MNNKKNILNNKVMSFMQKDDEEIIHFNNFKKIAYHLGLDQKKAFIQLLNDSKYKHLFDQIVPVINTGRIYVNDLSSKTITFKFNLNNPDDIIHFNNFLKVKNFLNKSKKRTFITLINESKYKFLFEELPKKKKIKLPLEVTKIMKNDGVSVLSAWRIYRGFSQLDIAEKLKLTQGRISVMEKKGVKLSDANLKKLAKIYECETEQLDI